ncbi:MAG: hypothetical protein AAFN41_13390, partial [Planctomycetota bacterium]
MSIATPRPASFDTAETGHPPFEASYGNFINGEFVHGRAGARFTNTSPVHGKPLCEVVRSDASDVEAALDAAHAVRRSWG